MQMEPEASCSVNQPEQSQKRLVEMLNLKRIYGINLKYGKTLWWNKQWLCSRATNRGVAMDVSGASHVA